jgi:hypothetical protein
MSLVKKIMLYIIITILIVGVIGYIILFRIMKPSNNRDWSPDQAVLSYAEINDTIINVHNIRNFEYASTTSYTQQYYDKTFDLNAIKRVYYIVEPFSGVKGAAHTFLSFEFEDGHFLAVSPEIRKEKGEMFSAVKGLFNQFEIMYVIADERDVIKLRTNYRKDQVFVYPIKASQEKTKALFLDIINHANHLKDTPEFYNSAFNNCATSIAKHVNAVTPNKVPFSIALILPESSDKLAYDLGVIDTDLPFLEARKKFNVNERAMKYADDPLFSIKIRSDL